LGTFPAQKSGGEREQGTTLLGIPARPLSALGSWPTPFGRLLKVLARETEGTQSTAGYKSANDFPLMTGQCRSCDKHETYLGIAILLEEGDNGHANMKASVWLD